MSSVDSKADAVVVSVPEPVSTVSSQTSAEFLKVMTDALASPPTTCADAVALYKNLSSQLANYLVNNLPSLEAKAGALAILVVKEVDVVSCLRC